MMLELWIHTITHSTDKARDITLDDENASQRDIPLVMALCNQPEAFALDLSDNQLRYLFCPMLKLGM